MSPSFTVILTSRQEDAGREALRQLVEDYSLNNVTFHQLDITNEQSISAFSDWLHTHFARGIDVLINNAGMAFKTNSDVPFKDQAHITNNTNYFGTLRITQAMLPHLLKFPISDQGSHCFKAKSLSKKP